MKTFKTFVINSTILLGIILLTSFTVTQGDAILGTWKEKDGTKTINIYKVGDSYFGKITENLSKDENKIEPGTIIMKNFVYEDEEWKGTIDIPTRNLSLKGKITLENDDEIKSVAMIAFIGKSKTWVRVK